MSFSEGKESSSSIGESLPVEVANNGESTDVKVVKYEVLVLSERVWMDPRVRAR